MNYSMSHTIRIDSEPEHDQDLLEQESHRIADEMELSCVFTGSSPACPAYVEVTGDDMSKLKVFYQRLMPFFYYY